MKILDNDLKFRLRYYWHRHVRKTRFAPREPVFFLHIPKTAGTSFRNMLFRMIDQQVSFPNFQDLAENNGIYPPTEALANSLPALNRNILFLTGHYPYAVGELLSKPSQYYIFLREPVARTVSNLLHFQRNEPALSDLSLIEIFDKYRVHLQNLQTRYLSDPSMDKLEIFFKPRLLSESDLDRAKAHLDQFTFVGLTEAFATSVSIAEKLLQIPLGRTLRHNVTPEQISDYDPELVAHIWPHIQFDLKLYEHALTIFERLRISVLGDKPLDEPTAQQQTPSL